MITKASLQEFFHADYCGIESLLREVLIPIFGEEEKGYTEITADKELQEKARRNNIRTIRHSATLQAEGMDIKVFDVTIEDNCHIHTARKGIQKLVREYVEHFEGAFIVFHYAHSEGRSWRLSYMEKRQNKAASTNAKRYTYLCGKDYACRTIAERFYKLQSEDKNAQTLESAFSVEALSDEFFDEYKVFYEDIVQYISGTRFVEISKNKYERRTGFLHDESIFDHFLAKAGYDEALAEKMVRDYVKKLLGRLVFLQFLQKKGWMGVPVSSTDWRTGDTHFMHNLFRTATSAQQADYINSVLNPIFFRCLNEQRNRDEFDTGVHQYGVGGKVRIPYLNGGLFEKDPLYGDIAVTLPAYFFSNTVKQEVERTFVKTATKSDYPYDKACGLFDFFDRYNFTIDENDPDDAEIGVDPEMLGKIFENLLEDNKDKGAYYTPKEIVRYMCEESLVAYLETECPKANKEDLRLFITTCTVPLIWLDEIQGVLQLNDIAKEVMKALRAVKICDPAIGSGAFPMGLLNILYHCGKAMDEYCVMEKVYGNVNAKIKRHIIQNNIYGVDIEKGAVDIARLRFWLALVVDEDEPEALPNLDYKIMQGNSLLEQYKGVDLSDLLRPTQMIEKQTSIDFVEENTERTILREYLFHYYSEVDHTKKAALRKEIEKQIRKLLKAKVPGRTDLCKEIDQLSMQNDKFFLWHTWFSDVFCRPSKQGFDIVIGNPPYGAKLSDEDKEYFRQNYVSAKTQQENKKKSIKQQKGSLDTYTLFLEQAYNIGCKNCSVSMIVPLSITSSESASGVHNLLFDNCHNFHISSYAVRPQPVFKNAVVDVSIITFVKGINEEENQIYATKLQRKGKNFNLQCLIDHLQFVDVQSNLLFGRIPKIGTETEKSILDKLKKNGKPLSEYIDTNNGKPIYYRAAGGRYFKVVTNYTTNSSAEKYIKFRSEFADSIGCILSSNLSFWFYQVYSDNHNWKSYEIKNFPMPVLSEKEIKELTKLYQEYLSDIEMHANVRQTSQESSYHVTTFKEYKIGKSKGIIDKIDNLIGPLYGLTKEEISFVQNYEIEFRLQSETPNEE